MSDPVSDVVAAIDCGTNSIRLLIATRDGSQFTDVHREMRVVRLGQGVDATGAFAPEAIERTRAALADYVVTMREAGVTALRMVATSATRDASNRDVFFDMTRELLGTVVEGAVAEVISGDEEAQLSFVGAVGELDPADGPFAVVDLGGGSTELVTADETGTGVVAFSANVGCVRITERYLHTDPPTTEEIAAARTFASEALTESFVTVPVEHVRTWVGVAGTMTTIAAVAQELPEYDPERVHLLRLPFDELLLTTARLALATRAERAALGPVHPGRVDVIGGGAIVVDVLAAEFAERAGLTEIVISEHDILDGIARSI